MDASTVRTRTTRLLPGSRVDYDCADSSRPCSRTTNGLVPSARTRRCLRVSGWVERLLVGRESATQGDQETPIVRDCSPRSIAAATG